MWCTAVVAGAFLTFSCVVSGDIGDHWRSANRSHSFQKDKTMDTNTQMRLVSFIIFTILSPRFAVSQDRIEPKHFELNLSKPVNMKLVQRQSDFIPGSNETLKLKLGDITGTMVLASVLNNKSNEVLRETPITIGEKIPFIVDEKKFLVTLNRLENRLVGEDSAELSIEEGEVPEDDTAPTSRYGDSIKTNVSGKLTFHRLTKRGWIEMQSREQEFALRPGDWCWLSQDEILKIVSATDTTVVYRLYQPAPTPKPF